MQFLLQQLELIRGFVKQSASRQVISHNLVAVIKTKRYCNKKAFGT